MLPVAIAAKLEGRAGISSNGVFATFFSSGRQCIENVQWKLPLLFITAFVSFLLTNDFSF